MARRTNGDLTPTETKFLKDHAPDAVVRFVNDRRNDLGVRIAAYSKVAAAARAERQALMEVHMLTLATMAQDPIKLQSENEQLRAQLTALKASPAMAIHSGTD